MNGDVLIVVKRALAVAGGLHDTACCPEPCLHRRVIVGDAFAGDPHKRRGVPGATGHRRMGILLNIEGEHEGFAIEAS